MLIRQLLKALALGQCEPKRNDFHRLADLAFLCRLDSSD